MLKKHLTSTAQAAGLVLLLAGGVSSQTLVREYIHFNGRPIAIEEPMGNQTPTADSVTPAGGGGTTTTFSFTFSDANGVQDLNVLNVLINSGLDGVNACYLAFSNNILYLVPDSGTGLQVVAEDPDNSQCLISNVNVSNTATTRTLSMSIQFFQPAFSGGRVIYMAASDRAGANSGWRIRGSYQVDYPTPPSIWTPALSPNAGSTQSQAFTITHRFTGGANAITGAQLLINTGVDGANAC